MVSKALIISSESSRFISPVFTWFKFRFNTASLSSPAFSLKLSTALTPTFESNEIFATPSLVFTFIWSSPKVRDAASFSSSGTVGSGSSGLLGGVTGLPPSPGVGFGVGVSGSL